MPRTVISVGRRLPGDIVESVSFRSDRSLLDADVVIFTPTLDEYDRDDINGRPVISDEDSPRVVRDCEHWQAEITTAVNAGKVIFIMLEKPEEVYYRTGSRTTSGRVTTIQTAPIKSYDSLPICLRGLVPKSGREFSVLRNLGALATYWKEFGSISEFQVYFEAADLERVLGTKNRERVTGAVQRAKGGGALVLLPPLKWDLDELTYARGSSTFWRKQAVEMGKRLAWALAGASEALSRETKRTPPPDWVTAPAFSLPEEDRLRLDLTKVAAEIKRLAERSAKLREEIQEAGELRGLAYETGTPLERAVVMSLRLFGFVAERYREATSEFDVVFVSPEGRFIGEKNRRMFFSRPWRGRRTRGNCLKNQELGRSQVVLCKMLRLRPQ